MDTDDVWLMVVGIKGGVGSGFWVFLSAEFSGIQRLEGWFWVVGLGSGVLNR
jgi:hypothetical protein